MVDRLQTFWIDYKRFGSVTQRQEGRTKDTLKAGPAPTPTPPHRSIIEYIFYYHYMYIRNVFNIRDVVGSGRRVGPICDFLVNPILTVIKMYMSGSPKCLLIGTVESGSFGSGRNFVTRRHQKRLQKVDGCLGKLRFWTTGEL